MIVVFGTQKGGTGKTTLAISFANYLSLYKEKEVMVYDFDYQKSFYQKWEEDNQTLEDRKLYEVEKIEDAEVFFDLEKITNMKDSEIVYIFDLAGTLDESYTDLLIYADYIVIPFEYSDVSAKSTLIFCNYLSYTESESIKIFIRSKYDKGYNYLNKEGMDAEISRFGKVLKNPVYKRNCLQTINTRKMTYEQKNAVKSVIEELIDVIFKDINIWENL